MVEDESRYNNMNMKWTLASHNLSGYYSCSLIVHCFMHLRYRLELKWMASALGDYETFLRFLKQSRTFNLNNNLYLENGMTGML